MLKDNYQRQKGGWKRLFREGLDAAFEPYGIFTLRFTLDAFKRGGGPDSDVVFVLCTRVLAAKLAVPAVDVRGFVGRQ